MLYFFKCNASANYVNFLHKIEVSQEKTHSVPRGFYRPTSLNENARKRELVKITLENQGILKRIKD